MVLTLADPAILAREATGHAECRLINRGEAKSTLHEATEGAARDMRWIELRQMLPLF